MNARRLFRTLIGILGLVAALCLSACGTSTEAPNAQEKALQRSENRVNFVPQNDVEGENYNARQRISDNPSTIIWCSVYPQNPNVKPYTVAIAGKLTSGNKRPYPTSQTQNWDSATYNSELPGPDGFYGSSGEYRYGFGPDGSYHDFYNMETYCTDVPTVIQKNTTDIAITGTGDLTSLDKSAQEALQACRSANPDPSVPCTAASTILGVN